MTIEQLPVPHPTFEDRQGATWYVWKDTAVMPHVADMYAANKRLDDAELAAEYWKAAYAAATFKARRRTRQLETMERFATLPSAV